MANCKVFVLKFINYYNIVLITGYYTYIESSYPRKVGDQAILLSQVFSPGTTYCMSFWYHMYGKGIGKSAMSFLPNQCTLWHSTCNFMWCEFLDNSTAGKCVLKGLSYLEAINYHSWPI